MTETADGTTAEASSEAEGTDESPEPKTTPEVDPISLARRRQAGAEAARQEATRQLKEAQERLDKYEAAERTTDQTKAADIATLQAKLDAAEKRAADADINANAKILDIKFPNARAKLPEITDEVRLAEFEQLFAEVPEGNQPPSQPQNPNASNRAASGDATANKGAEETSEDIKARLKVMRPDWL